MILSIAYELTGPDGTRAVVGNTDDAKNDVDFVGYLDPENGITGLDAAAVRESSVDRVEGDGGWHGDFYMGRRPVTISGDFHPVDMSLTAFVVKRDRVLRASKALRADATLAWTEPGQPRKRLLLRRAAETRITGRRPKKFAASMVSADARILSALEQSVDTGAGITSPRAVAATAVGDDEALPVIRFYGPAGAGLTVAKNSLNGRQVVYNRAIAGGAWVEFDLTHLLDGPTVIDSAGVDQGDGVTFLTTTWPTLSPGANVLTFTWAGGGAANRATVRWRDAWA